MSDKLAIIEDGYTYRICWVVDGEEGAWLGDYLRHYLQHNSSMDGTNEHRIATEAANQAGGCEIDNLGLLWESKARAQEALVSARAALKAARSSKPYPEWAIKALAAGWKAPKGWVP